MAVAVMLASVAAGHAAVDVSGSWRFCMAPNPNTNQGPRRPDATLTQVGSQVSGSVVFPFFQGTLTCVVEFEIDAATGAVVPDTQTEQCQLGAAMDLRPAIASRDRIDGEHLHPSARAPFFGLRACDPLAVNPCDDGDPSTTDTCSTTVDCFGVALAPSCVHTGCTIDADCTDPFPCTFDRCDAATGCGHPVMLQANDPPSACEDGDACTVEDRCQLAICGEGPLTETVTSMTAPRVALGKLGPPSGDDTLVVKGRAVLPAPLTIEPTENGVRVYVIDADGAVVVDETLPGGAFDPLTGVGWSSSGRTVRYDDKRTIDPGAIRKVSIRADLATPGLVRFDIKGKAGSYLGTPTLPLGLFVNLDPDPISPGSFDPDPLDGGACGDFAGAPAGCRASSSGTKISCR